MRILQRLSLRSKLHAGLGLMFLTVAGIAAVTMVLVKRNLEASERMTDHVTPTAQASLQMLGGLNHSMAALRGWMLLGQPEYREDRRAAVEQEIQPALAELKARAGQATLAGGHSELPRLEALLGQVLADQQEIEDIAQTPANVPALRLLVEEAAPLTFLMADTLSHLIDLERRRDPDPARRELLFVLAHTHGSTNSAAANLRDYLLTGDEQYREAWTREWMRSRTRFLELSLMDFLMTEAQRQILETHRAARERFDQLADELVGLRGRPDWNVANHRMGTRAAPVTAELAQGLRALVEQQSGLLQETAAEIRSNTRNLNWSAWLLMTVAFLVAAALAHMVVRSVIGPLNQIRGAMARVQEAGDLGRPIELSLNPRDEIGSLVAEFNRMAVELRRTSVSKTYVENILGSMSDALTVLDPDGLVQYANPSLERWLGYPEGAIRGKRFRDLVDLGRARSYTGWLAAVHRSGTVTGLDAIFLRADGSRMPVSLSASLLRDAGASVGIVCVAQDIAERLALQEQMQSAREAAEAANRAKSDFLARMSHEIRTPMNGVIGMTELLSETELSERQRRFVDNVWRSAQSLLAIINDILDFSKIEAGKLELDDAPFDLRQLVDEAAELFAERAHRTGVELLCAVAPDIPTALRGDAGRLRQVVVNLLGNAFKFTATGEVALRVSRLTEEEEGLTLRFEVRDTGCGISPEAQGRIFESFAQADGSITRKHGGTGLGLAISRRLVELMGGAIGLASAPGHGSAFWFTARFAKEVGATGNGRFAPDQLGSLRVLVVDDNATNRAILDEQLSAWGIPHALADGAESAIEQWRAAARAGRPFNLGLFDKDMPGMDGIELARTLRQESVGAGPPVVMLSSLWRELSPQELGAIGIRAYLTKPVRQSQLYNAMLGVLHGDLRLPAGARPEPDAGLTRFDGAGQRVLLVEDNPVNQELGREMLRALGCVVDVAEDGEQALAAIARGTYSLVLMDCQMPVLDGFEATRRLRGEEQARRAADRLPVVALTANALVGDRERCLAAGMDDYLSKPFTMAQLSEMLARWLPRATGEPRPTASWDGGGSAKAAPAGTTPGCCQPSAAGPAATAAPAPVIDPPPGLAVSSGPVPAAALPAADPEAEMPRLDPKALDVVRALQRPGAPDMVAKVVGLYLQSAGTLVASLREAADRGDAAALRAAAHSMKSSSANVGAARLSAMSKGLEGLAREGRLEDAPARVAAIATELEAVAQALAPEVRDTHQREVAA